MTLPQRQPQASTQERCEGLLQAIAPQREAEVNSASAPQFAFSSCFPNSLPQSTPQESSSIQVSLSASVPRQLDPSPLTNQGTLDEILSFSTAKYSHPQDGDNSSAFHEGVVRIKQVKSPKSPKTVPVYSKYSINAYYELLL